MGIVDNALMGASGQSGYNLTRSLRFRSSASAYLSRTPASASNRQIWTWSAWVKRGILGTGPFQLFAARTSGGATFTLFYFNIDSLKLLDSGGANITTTAVYRDPSAWYHIILAVDTTQATASNRVKLYVNGSQVTAFSTATYPVQNANLFVNSTLNHSIARQDGAPQYFDGYLAEVNFIDGQALTPSSFGSTNALTGVWQPARYTGTYGTNGFYLKFTDNSTAAALGTDFSGNSNTWTTNNISVTAGVTYDSMTDVPTLTSATAANFAVLNPLDKNSSITASSANLVVSAPSGFSLIRSTFFVSSGKYYWEIVCDDCGNGFVGISSAAEGLSTRGAETANSATINTANGNIRTNGADSAYGSAVSDGNIMMFALDMSSGKFWAGKSGTWFNSGDPAAGTNAGKTGLTVAVSPSISLYDNEDYTANFGQRPFAYTPPTGFVSLNAFNLPDSTIVKGNTVMDATLYTGTGASLSVTNTASFKPDLVWVKSRSAATDHAWYDSVRGTTKQLESNTTTAETTEATGLTTFGSAGFTVGALAQMNTSAATYVGWQWQAGQGTTSTNTNGTITSTVSVNASAGFSVVTYTGTNVSGATIGHGLGVAPQWIVVKNRDAADAWQVYHAANTANPETDYLVLNTTAATVDAANRWNDTAPTSSVFSIGNGVEVNTNTEKYVAYCWTPIAGFSAFGSYTGNGSTDGSFVYTGFRPKWVMVKATSTAENWAITDSARSSFNAANALLRADESSAETTGAMTMDFNSNGFKMRTTDSKSNGSGVTYIYIAFAENPFKNALAR